VTHTYSYDLENRLIKVNDGSADIFTASYDYRTRRYEKLANSATTRYIYDGGVNVQEYAVDGQGQSSLTKQLIRGTGMGGGIGSALYSETVASGSVTNTEYFAYNAVGSVVALLNGSGVVTDTTDYEAFGKEVRSSGSSTENRKFCTKERDTSIGLDNFGFRYFDWELGRFTTRDPSGYPDGPNNYLYCHNNPINFVDPLGLVKRSEYKEYVEELEAKRDAEIAEIEKQYDRL
jgi:RHS repeat-associated protein